jgi:hypothetical protein
VSVIDDSWQWWAGGQISVVAIVFHCFAAFAGGDRHNFQLWFLLRGDRGQTAVRE